IPAQLRRIVRIYINGCEPLSIILRHLCPDRGGDRDHFLAEGERGGFHDRGAERGRDTTGGDDDRWIFRFGRALALRRVHLSIWVLGDLAFYRRHLGIHFPP